MKKKKKRGRGMGGVEWIKAGWFLQASKAKQSKAKKMGIEFFDHASHSSVLVCWHESKMIFFSISYFVFMYHPYLLRTTESHQMVSYSSSFPFSFLSLCVCIESNRIESNR